MLEVSSVSLFTGGNGLSYTITLDELAEVSDSAAQVVLGDELQSALQRFLDKGQNTSE